MHCSRSAEDGGLFRGESSHGTLGVVGPFTGEGSTGFGQYGLWGNNPREKLGLSQEESAERRVSTTLRQVLTEFSELFLCWIGTQFST